MKKNLIAIGSFIVLLILTIFYQKNLVEDYRAKIEEQKRIFNVQGWGKLEQIELPKINLQVDSTGELRFTDGDPVDEVVSKQLMRILSHIKLVRVIKGQSVQDSLFFPTALIFKFHFARGVLVCKLGEKLNFSQSFYLQVAKGKEVQTIIAQIDLPLEGVFTEEQRRTSDYFYRQLRGFILADKQDFYSRKIIAPQVVQSMEQINFIEEKFTLDFKHQRLIPHAPEGINLWQEKVQQFIELLEVFDGQEVFLNSSSKDIGQIIRRIEVVTSQQKIMLKLFRRFKEQIGWYIYSSQSHHVYQVSRSLSRVFFYTPSYFWQKAVVINDPSSLFLEQQGSYLDLKYQQQQWIVARNTHWTVEQKKVENLINFLRRQADMVEQRSRFPFTDYLFKIKLSQRSLFMLRLKQEIQIWDSKRKLLFHYWIGGDIPIETNIENYLMR